MDLLQFSVYNSRYEINGISIAAQTRKNSKRGTHMNREFADILGKLKENHEAALERTVEGHTYIRKFAQQERLILLGAGHVSQAVADFAAKLDFSVTVVDDRPFFANASRFPAASEIICEQFVTAIREKLHIYSRDYVCVLTRGHRWDADCLRAILPGEMPYYLGMIGSRRRVSGLLALLKDEGFDPKRLEKIHTPIGLSIGALTPAEIAISIAAELILERRSLPKEEEVLEQTNVDEAMLCYAAEADIPKAMILVLETKGSTPAKTGAMMLLDHAGHTFGTVGGGCSEGEALLKARRLLGTGGSEVVYVDLTNEIAEEEGMVCGGTMKLLLEDISL